MLIAAALAMAQLVVPAGDGLSVEQRVALLARTYGPSSRLIERVIFDDPAMRAEIRRIGFARGCDAAVSARREVGDRHAAALRAAYVDAIRRVIPEQMLAQARPVSFVAGPLTIYSGRVEREVQRSAAPLFAVIAADMRRSFLARTGPMAATTDEADNRIVPRRDIAVALGIGVYWDLDNPNHLAMACIEQRISPSLRPTITTGPAPR
jgi:hypothetical protein